MSAESAELEGPDLTQGVALSSLAEGEMMLGHAHGEQLILTRSGQEVFAVGAVCSHYGGPLASGLVVDDTVRCPWHHACFSLRTGEALRAPGLDPVPCWHVEQSGDKAFVREKLQPAARRPSVAGPTVPGSVVIVGGGAAGNAAAEMLRREGYDGRLTMLSADQSAPYDRPNLSKNYLAGSAPEEWIPLRTAGFYQEHAIDLRLGVPVAAIDTAIRQVRLVNGERHSYDALILATGAEPVRLAIPGAELPHVHYLRTLADSRALVAAASVSKRAVVIGASFIGLEVAASLRARDIDVHVIGRERCPMVKILGNEVGGYLQKLHEAHGVTFHLGTTATSIDAQSVVLENGETIAADLVVIGVGVRPATALSEQAGLAVDRGVAVDQYLQTSVPGVNAVGDIARWPDPLTG